MFRFLKKKREFSKTEELLNMAVEDIRDRWINYTQSKRFKNDVTLSENIDNFVQPLTEFFKNRYLRGRGVYPKTRSLIIQVDLLCLNASS